MQVAVGVYQTYLNVLFFVYFLFKVIVIRIVIVILCTSQQGFDKRFVGMYLHSSNFFPIVLKTQNRNKFEKEKAPNKELVGEPRA